MKKISQVWPAFDTEAEFVDQAIQDRWITEGPFTERFRSELIEYTGAQYAVFAPNGTLGLFLALLALDLPPKSEVIIPAFTFFGTASAVVFAGLTPVIVDVDPDTYTMDPELMKAAITEKTSCVMPVHIYGQAAYMDEYLQIAAQNGLPVLEDAAQAFGVHYAGRHAGTLGDVGVISFFADKTLTTGEGAVVFCKDEILYSRLKLLRNQGRPNSGTFIHPSLGMNFRITDLQAAIGCRQIQKTEEILGSKVRNYNKYHELLGSTPGIRTMEVDDKSTFIPFRYPITTENPEVLIGELERNGIQTRRFFYPMHLQPGLKGKIHVPAPCKNSELLYETGIALPIHSKLTDQEIELIATVIKNAV